MTTDDHPDKGVIDHVAEGAIPGAIFGTLVAASRSYFHSHTTLDPSESALKSAIQPNNQRRPTTQALQALAPKPLPALVTTVAAYSAVTGLFTAASAVSANLRGKNDILNNTIGGIVAGSVVGLRTGSLYASAGASAALGASAFFLGLMHGTLGSIGDVSVQRRKDIYRE